MPLQDPQPFMQLKQRFVDGNYSNSAGTLTYKLLIPSAFSGKPMPLLVMLHGCTQSAVDFAAGTHMNELAARDGFFVVYPEQSESANISRCWNWFQAENQARTKGEPSLIAGITKTVMRRYGIDAQRVYVAGMSAGGAMATILAATYPDLYAAVGVHSGLAYKAAHDLDSGFSAMRNGPVPHKQTLFRAIPMITFHGSEDTTVAAVNAQFLMDQWLHAMNGNGMGPVSGPKVERGRIADGHSFTRSIYQDGEGQAVVEAWIAHGAGHAWLGGNPRGSFTDPRGPSASIEFLRFFKNHTRKHKMERPLDGENRFAGTLMERPGSG